MVQQGVMPPHYIHELPAEDEARLEKMFQELDLDGNGKVDVHDLSKALHKAGVHEKYAQVRINFHLVLKNIYLFILTFYMSIIDSFHISHQMTRKCLDDLTFEFMILLLDFPPGILILIL